MSNHLSRLNPPRKRRRGLAPAVAMAAIVPVMILGAIGVNVARANAVETHTACTVTEKEDRALASLDDRSPRIYTDCGVFVIGDEPLRFHFTAADIYNTVQVGHAYDVAAVGWRFPLFSWFPNITEAEVTP